MAQQFTWIKFAAAKQALALRLADPGNIFWGNSEIGLYIIEALRTWNALTATWNQDYVVTVKAPINNQVWYSLGGIAGYPRQRTVTDIDLYTLMEYHLLEPATGGTWSGTSQFTMADLAGALQRRRDEIIQFTACNLAQVNVPSVPNVRRVVLPDNILQPIRARFVPANPLVRPCTLWRNDDLAYQYFAPGFLQNQPSPGQQPPNPQSYGVITGAPLAFDLDYSPKMAGKFDLVALLAGAALAPPAPSGMSMPDDFTWVAKWGAMSDLFGRESEATDNVRADYCLQRYKDGIKLMSEMPWILLSQINGISSGTPSLAEMDAFAAEWDSNPAAYPTVVVAGTDFVAYSPIPTKDTGITLTVVGNAPIPVNDNDYVQITRDTFDVLLDYAQALAMFKQGGQEFIQSKELTKNFFLSAVATNARLAEMGLFRDILLEEGERQMENQPRFAKTDQ